MSIFNLNRARAVPEVFNKARKPDYSVYDVLSANIMIADTDYDIVYANPAVLDMLLSAEVDIKKDLPRFSVNTVVGTSMDDFHVNPSHQRGVLDKLSSTYKTKALIGGRTFELVASPMFNEQSQRSGTIVEWFDLTELTAERKLAVENSRIRSALVSVTGNVMIADADNVIVFCNDSVKSMLRASETDLRKVLPNFSVDNLVGVSIDDFHANPGHQRGLLDGLNSTYKTQIEIAGHIFALVANPVFGADRERIGTVVEWLDKTDEVATNKEIQSIVEAASDGDLESRISLDGKEGFFHQVSSGVNSLFDVMQGITQDINALVAQAIKGNLEERISLDGKGGMFLELSQSLNSLVDTFDHVVTDVNTSVGALAEGDLTRSINADYPGAFGELKDNVNETIGKLTEVVSEIKDSASLVKSGSEEIASGNTNLSQRTEEQAASLEETSSAMEEMTSTIQQNAGNAKAADGLAQGARDSAENGGKVVGSAVEAMAAISESSKKISDIISVIDEIAFQTNLLALNASVEAARAGDQGRGFAVVADEVRNLAGRSATAAKEIKELIVDSGAKVEEGSRLVNQSGETLDEIVVAVKKVSDIITEISTASEEQAAGIDEVNKAVIQMDEMTQQNAALVEEAAAASESLGEQSENLDDLISFFNVGGAPKSRKVAKSRAKVREPGPSRQTTRSRQSSVSKTDDDDWAEF